MRVLMINPVGTVGGAEKCLLTAAKGLLRLGCDVHVIAATDGPLIEQASQLGARARVLPMPANMTSTGEFGGIVRAVLRGILVLPSVWRYARKLRTAIGQLAPDVIHSNGLKIHTLLAMARPAAPVVWHLHDFLASRGMASRLLRRASRRASRAIAISQAVARDASAVLGEFPVDVVTNAIDTARFAPGTANAIDLDALAIRRPDLPPLPPGAIRIGLVATYARWKGQNLFIRAAARARRQAPELPMRFYIVGGPIYHTAGSQWSAHELEDLCDDLKVEQDVILLPFQPDTASIYRALDVVVHASTRPEPFGLTIVEAMACGKPVIVSSAGGAAEIITDGVDALGFPPGDEAALADHMVALAKDTARRHALGAAARQTAITRFDDARYGQQILEVYRRAMGTMH